MKILLLVAFFLVLTQDCIGRSVHQHHKQHLKRQERNAEKFVQLSIKNPFYEAVAKDFTEYSIGYFDNIHKSIEKTLKELTKVNWEPEFVVEIENLQDIDCELHCILNDVINQTIPKVVHTYGVINNLQIYYNNTSHKESPVWKLLQQFNIESIFGDYHDFINTYFDKFTEDFKIYAKNLESESVKNHQELFEWFESFSSQTDKEMRFYKFLEFFFYWDNFDLTKFWNL